MFHWTKNYYYGEIIDLAFAQNSCVISIIPLSLQFVRKYTMSAEWVVYYIIYSIGQPTQRRNVSGFLLCCFFFSFLKRWKSFWNDLWWEQNKSKNKLNICKYIHKLSKSELRLTNIATQLVISRTHTHRPREGPKEFKPNIMHTRTHVWEGAVDLQSLRSIACVLTKFRKPTELQSSMTTTTSWKYQMSMLLTGPRDWDWVGRPSRWLIRSSCKLFGNQLQI